MGTGVLGHIRADEGHVSAVVDECRCRGKSGDGDSGTGFGDVDMSSGDSGSSLRICTVASSGWCRGWARWRCSGGGCRSTVNGKTLVKEGFLILP